MDDIDGGLGAGITLFSDEHKVSVSSFFMFVSLILLFIFVGVVTSSEENMSRSLTHTMCQAHHT